MVNRKNDLYTFLLCFRKEGGCSLLVVLFNQTLADAVTLDGKERICHTPTDYNGIAGSDQTLKHADLTGDL